jgi:hypothetical protein
MSRPAESLAMSCRLLHRHPLQAPRHVAIGAPPRFGAMEKRDTKAETILPDGFLGRHFTGAESVDTTSIFSPHSRSSASAYRTVPDAAILNESSRVSTRPARNVRKGSK